MSTEKPKSENITWHAAQVAKEDRESQQGHKGAILWYTGLSGSGKSTLADEVQKALHERRVRTYLLDGDNIRHGLNKDLGFSAEDRQENIRRISEVARLFVDAGVILSTAFISPYRRDRDQARALVAESEFIEIYVKCDLAICEERDPKGLYKKARAGEIEEFTGVSAPYEAPENAEITVETDKDNLEQSVGRVIAYLEQAQVIPSA